MSENDKQREFDHELAWCLEQLRFNLENNRISVRQVQETQKAMKTLQNPKAPLAKKRQVMRMSLGDYRAKMKAEESKIKLNSKMTTDGKNTPKNFRFLKKSMKNSQQQEQSFTFKCKEKSKPQVLTILSTSNSNDKETYPEIKDNEGNEEQDGEDKDTSDPPEITQNYTSSSKDLNLGSKFIPSSNTFRFNFQIIE